jgi:hypothetical protein
LISKNECGRIRSGRGQELIKGEWCWLSRAHDGMMRMARASLMNCRDKGCGTTTASKG